VVCVAVACVAAALGDGDTARRRSAEALELSATSATCSSWPEHVSRSPRTLARSGERGQAVELLQLAGVSASAMGATTLLAEAETALSELESAG